MPVKVFITITDGPDKGLTFDFAEGEIMVGRGKGDLALSDKKVSGHHCTFRIDGNSVYVEDQGSTNGTFIGGRRVENAEQVQNLDEIIVGLTKLSVAIVDQIGDFNARKGAASTASTRVAPQAAAAMSQIGRTQPLPEPPSPSSEDELPPADAEYRTTGIRRIDNLIEGEMQNFSKWDDPAVPDQGEKVVPRVKVQLIVRKGPDGVSSFTCTKSVSTLGRKDVDVRLNDLDCSRKHAAIEIIGGDRVYVRDLASTNGTYVNGKRVAHQELQPGDLVQIGQTVLEVKIESSTS